jgi:glutamyl-Q tRNA(Asp) synthetase
MDASKAPHPSAPYRGRFAPSPTGPLHLGSLATALGSWLDARAHKGKWLVRIEDVDTPRTIPGADQIILQQLEACGLEWDEEVVWQSQRNPFYQVVLDQLFEKERVYACQCSRKQIEEVLQQQDIHLKPNEDLVYPATCRKKGLTFKHHAIRIALPTVCQIEFTDRHLGTQFQDLNQEVGDFVLRRADGLFTYQLAVVIDDNAQQISHVVRGMDLLSNTARQIYLQHCLGFSRPNYLHLPLVTNPAGEKLSKQTKASPIDISNPKAIHASLRIAAMHLGLSENEVGGNLSQWLSDKVSEWQECWLG